MKRCPVCEKEFDDSLRFCQVDGTPLVDKAEAEEVDPFKTMVARKEDIAAAIPKEPALVVPPPPEPSVPAPIENELLEIPPAADPNKTQFVSEAELRAEMAAHEADEQVIDVPPIGEPEPPKFVEPESSGSPFGGAPPPSPFSTPSEREADEPGPANFPTSPPIPSPFSAPPKAEMEPQESLETPSPFADPVSPEPDVKPFEPAPGAPLAQAEANSPVVNESNMQNPQDFGQNAPYNAPPASGGGQNQTLAIVSLVLGILGLTLCCGWFIVSLAAVITGFMARGKASSDPANYGGSGLALGGLITGLIGILGSIIVWIYVALNFAVIMASMPR